MRPSSNHPVYRYSGTLLAICLLAAGCSGAPKVHTSAKGSVQLQEVADWSYEATHPAVIDQMTLLKILKGIAEDDQRAKLPASGTKPMRIFSDEDAEFLAPLLAQGLSQAKPEQIVGFTVSSSAGSGTGPTAGTVYVQGGTINFAVSAHNKTLSFTPGSAARQAKAPSYASAGSADAVSFAVDYQALAKSPMPQSATMASAKPMPKSDLNSQGRVIPVSMAGSSVVGETSPEELRKMNAAKDSEIQVLRREVEWMKRELKERSDEIKALKSSKVSTAPASKRRTAEAYPNR